MIRLLVANKRNFPFAMQRRSARDKGKMFSEYHIMMRCVRGNHRVSLNNMHYLENDTIVLSVAVSCSSPLLFFQSINHQLFSIGANSTTYL